MIPLSMIDDPKRSNVEITMMIQTAQIWWSMQPDPSDKTVVMVREMTDLATILFNRCREYEQRERDAAQSAPDGGAAQGAERWVRDGE